MTLQIALSGQVSADFALDVTIEVPLSGVTALVGPSGSGKTSVLRAVAGLERCEGSVSFKTECWQDARAFVPAERRRIGYVFQGMGLLPHLSVRQNLDYAARRAPAGPFNRADVIARTGLSGLLDRNPSRLSGGEAQRANIARALLSQPRLLLLDEPLTALDEHARSQLLSALHELLSATGTPMLYVSHDLAEVTQIAAKVIRLANGRLDASTPD